MEFLTATTENRTGEYSRVQYVVVLNDENCDDKVETMTNNVECIDSTKSYKLYLQGCHWFPSSPLQPN